LSWVAPETPLVEKPSAEFEVSLDVTLGEVLEVAGDAWGMRPGPGQFKYGTGPVRPVRFGFVRPDDASGVDSQIGYTFPRSLPVVKEDGTAELVLGSDVTFRELLVASRLGLLKGDVTRPYLHPSIPQGVGLEGELARLTIEAIQAAYRAVDTDVGFAEHTLRLIQTSWPSIKHTAGAVVNEEERVGTAVWPLPWVWSCWNWLRNRRRPKGDDPNMDRPE